MLRYPVPNVNGDVGLHGEILRKPAHIRPNPFRILTCNVQGVAPLQHHSGPRAIQSHTNAPIAAANIFAQVGKAHMQPATGLYGNLHRPFASCRAPVSYTHLRAHETKANLVCRLLLEKKKKTKKKN